MCHLPELLRIFILTFLSAVFHGFCVRTDLVWASVGGTCSVSRRDRRSVSPHTRRFSRFHCFRLRVIERTNPLSTKTPPCLVVSVLLQSDPFGPSNSRESKEYHVPREENCR